MRNVFVNVLIGGLLLFSTCASAQISLVNVTSCAEGIFPAATCAITPTGSGHLIVVGWKSVGATGTGTVVSSITDNAGNSYSEAGAAKSTDATHNAILDIWYAKNSRAGATTVTITPNPGGIDGGGVVWEFAGVDTNSPLDQTSVLNNQSATATPSGSPIAASANEVIISAVNSQIGISGIVSGKSFHQRFYSNWSGLGTPPDFICRYIRCAMEPRIRRNLFSYYDFLQSGRCGSVNACDLATPYGTINTADVQAAINMTLGSTPCTANIDGSGVCNVVVVQRVVNASMPGGTCVTGTTVAHSVSLNWAASSTPNVTYNVYRSVTSGSYSTPLASSGTATSYTDTAVQAGQNYYYVVTAVSGGTESAHSNEVPATVPSP